MAASEVSSRSLVDAHAVGLSAVDVRPLSDEGGGGGGGGGGGSGGAKGGGGSGGAKGSGATAPRPSEVDINSDSYLEAVRAQSAIANARGTVYRFPKVRVGLALLLLVTGFCLMLAGMINASVLLGVLGAVVFLPGGYMSYVYLQVWRGNPRFRREDWLVAAGTMEEEDWQ